MTTLDTFLKGVEERLAKAVPGPWRYRGEFKNYEELINQEVVAYEFFDSEGDDTNYVARSVSHVGNGKLIASAPTDLALLVKIVCEAKETLHLISQSMPPSALAMKAGQCELRIAALIEGV